MTTRRDLTPHPGKTATQRRVLDEIGCGNFSPIMNPKTKEALLSAGLIVSCGREEISRDRFGSLTVEVFEMPIGVHMQWCAHQAGQIDALPPEERARLERDGS